ncbi:MAG TPA: OB-fold domain-containing protein [Marmoricola sp.]|nr:OB-fold domain-containing protein [Marmoricola sp.]HNI70423.1 OB-fold domain-containing protein [Marmoricola sp.]HNJ77756.1 OB-fold domain-containing protein [Marmoricola sp.]HNN47950.1 OB-fold domain-containing protein [Marmoricola sp.]HNO39755.1 OB-fold domain-containing protein [Marmoricola sp.]
MTQATESHPDSGCLHAPIKVEFDYTRSLGGVLSDFMTGLRSHQVQGARLSDGTIACPPPEYDPITLEPITELVPISSLGSVLTWSWVAEPVKGQPLSHPFAFALIQLDGADEPLLHAVAAEHHQMQSGMRVRVEWAAETRGDIRDIAYFVPAQDETNEFPATAQATPDQVTGLISPVHLEYDYAASPEESKFFRGLAEGRILGQRCPKCHKVYVPPRGACPVDGVPTQEEVELAQKGTVTTFCIVNVPFLGQKIKPPYVSAYVLLDGADIAFLHLILDCPAEEVRMGMRVEAVWKPRDEWGTTIENISHFRPIDEPDADYETYKQHL